MSYNGLHLVYATQQLSYTKITFIEIPKVGKQATTRVFQGIEEQIATGQLKDGAKLDEVSLAERFEVSRTPVREAKGNRHRWTLLPCQITKEQRRYTSYRSFSLSRNC